MPSFCLFVCLLGWWACNCSITESLPELIQQVRQDLSGAQHYKKYTVPTNLSEQYTYKNLASGAVGGQP